MQIEQQQLKKIALANESNPYADVTAYELGFGVPDTFYDGFFPQPGEVLIYAAPAQTFADKEQVVGYSGKSAGVSVRVAKGVSVRSGRSGGNTIRGTVRQTKAGDLLITNKRILFSGKDDSFDIPLQKISMVKPLSRTSLLIQSGQSSKNLLFDEYSIQYALGFINFVLKSNQNGDDIYETFCQRNAHLTPEQQQLCDEARAASAKIKTPKKKRAAKTKRQWRAVKILFALCIAILVLGIVLSLTVKP